MRQVLQDRAGTTVVRDVPPPPCSPGSILVRNAFSAISSGTERARVELSQKSLLGKARERPDLVRQVIARAQREGIRATRDAVKRRLEQETPVGYSSAGVVVEVGEAVAGFDVGDRVACAGGEHANHAEIVSVPANLCARVPDAVELEMAAMTTIAAIAMHGIRLADVRLGDRVGVVGCGLVGQIACRLLRAAGAHVIALDLDPGRVRQAIAGGAHHGLRADAAAEEGVEALTHGIGLDQVVITAAAATNAPLLLASAIARDRGAVVLVGDVPIEAPRAAFYDKELSFIVSRSYGPGRYDSEYEERGLDYPVGYVRWTEKRNMEAVLALQAQGALRLNDLVEEIIDVSDAPRAYARLTASGDGRPQGALLLAYGDGDGDATGEPIVVEAMVADRARNATRPPVRVALIGPGSFAARIIAPALRAAGARLEVVAGGSGPSAEATGRRLGFARVAATVDQAIADPEVDAVMIATPHGAHGSLAAQALRAGKHVFCEKPLALTEGELGDVLGAAAESNGILAVGFNRRFSPLLRQMRQQVAGADRKVVAVYRVSAGPLPAEHWLHDLADGGGRVIGEACHFVDSLAFLADSRITQVYATGYGALGAPLQARDNVVIALTFENGSVGSLVYTGEGSPKVAKERVELFSGARSAVLDDFRSLEIFGRRRRTVSLRTQEKGYTAEIAAFLQGVEEGRAPVALAVVGNVSLATLAVIESLRTGKAVRVAVSRGDVLLGGLT